MVRLNKYLADCGVASRRKCDELIEKGRVSVNGLVEQTLGTKIDIEHDQVSVDNKPVSRNLNHEYILLNKPAGFVTTSSDERDRITVMHLIQSKNRLFPVGRLDKESQGLLLLTNDGELTYRLTHPKFHVPKVYQARLNKRLLEKDRRQFEKGIELEEGITAPCKVVVKNFNSNQQIRITLYQGWKRQIRRMFDHLGYRVVALKRVKIGSLQLGQLPEGQWRSLTQKEVETLRKYRGAGHRN